MIVNIISYASRLGSIIRINRWWLYKVSPLLGIVYLFLYVKKIPITEALQLTTAFTITTIGIAGSGYFINDFFDAAKDGTVGKKNELSDLPLLKKTGLAFLLCALAFLPWLYLPSTPIIWALIGFQYLLYVLYSHTLFRLKEKHLWGIVCDALYGHALPVIIASLTFNLVGALTFRFFTEYLFLAFAWQMLKGIRNILLHQLDDRKNDKRSGVNTFVTHFGAVKTVDLINRFILPAEFSVLLILIAIISVNVTLFYLSFILFIIHIALYFCAWKFSSLPSRDFKFKFLYVLNDYYEVWIPLIFLVYLISFSWYAAILILVHLVLFSEMFGKFKFEFSKIYSNLKGFS